jgi:hypothetical protein
MGSAWEPEREGEEREGEEREGERRTYKETFVQLHGYLNKGGWARVAA